mmetsp:Transcript_9250/g.18218  ORF Transcript_9250/g.18218 Transcript_9250/m.18218 type:complete len:206 (+) Transcript_9250:790-1407(+)
MQPWWKQPSSMNEKLPPGTSEVSAGAHHSSCTSLSSSAAPPHVSLVAPVRSARVKAATALSSPLDMACLRCSAADAVATACAYSSEFTARGSSASSGVKSSRSDGQVFPLYSVPNALSCSTWAAVGAGDGAEVGGNVGELDGVLVGGGVPADSRMPTSTSVLSERSGASGKSAGTSSPPSPGCTAPPSFISDTPKPIWVGAGRSS